jgi:hypothetical protein
MIVWCDHIDTKEYFLGGFDEQVGLCTLNYKFFKLSFLFNESNHLEAHPLNLRFS